jgi:cation diffusion facilitator family transporter
MQRDHLSMNSEDSSATTEAVQRERLVLLAVVTTFISLIPSAYATVISNSMTLVADLLRCSTEFVAILISWFILKKVARSDVKHFNYGFGKLEQLSCMAVGGALFVTFLLCFVSGIHRILAPEPVVGAEFGFVLAVLSVLGNLFLWITNHRSFKRHASPVSDAQRRLFRAKTAATMVVSLSLGAALFLGSLEWSVYFDGLGSVLLSLFMLWSAYALVSSSFPDLIDCALEESLQVPIREVLKSYRSQYLDIHKIRSRRTGKRIFVELFISFAPLQTFAKVNDIARHIRSDVESALKGAEVIVVPLVVDQEHNA